MRVLHGQEIGGQVVKLIDGAQKRVIIVSAYYDPWLRATTAIENAIARGVSVAMILRGGKDQKKHLEATAPLRAKGVKVRFLDRLHAKFYATEGEAIVTSMNLIGTSAQDSWEMGVHLERGDSAALQQLGEGLKDLVRQVELEEARLKAGAQEEPAAALASLLGAALKGERGGRASPLAAVLGAALSAATGTAEDEGHCIRCGTDVTLNVDRPFCRACYKKWAEYENDDYKESYCHNCGDDAKTSKARPQCRKCYRASVVA